MILGRGARSRAVLVRAGAAALLLLAGCASRAVLPPPLLVHPSDDPELLAQVARLHEQGQGRHSIRALARVRIAGPRGSGRVREVILARRPAELRLEGLNFLGQTQSLLVTDGEHFLFFDGREVEQGPLRPETLLRTLGLDLEPAEAVEALLAAPLGGPELRSGPREVRAQGEERWLFYSRERLRLGPDGELRAMEALGPQGSGRWMAEYAGWRSVAGGRYPFEMVLSFPGTELRAELDFEQVELNPELDAALFRPSLGGERP